jgi:predicted nucleic acid-binding protein
VTQKLLFDTSALVAFEQGHTQAVALYSNGKHAASAVAVMEFNQGAGAPFGDLFPAFSVVSFGLAEAKVAAEKMRELRPIYAAIVKDLSRTQTKDFMARLSLDLMIGATALVNGYTIVNRNPLDFSHYKTLKAITI